MDIEILFEKARAEGLFTDYDVCVKGPRSLSFSGGKHVRAGARLFDIASLTKACTHLLFLKLFSKGILSPEDSYNRYIPVIQQDGDDRQLWHFLCYTVLGYNIDYESLRDGTTPSIKNELLSKGFGHWSKRHRYDNIASAYLAILLEKMYGADIEEILHAEILLPEERSSFLFHPVRRNIVDPSFVVPTRIEDSLRGLVHDPLSFHHQDSNLSVAGVFSTAEVLAGIFHRMVDRLISDGFYSEVASNQLLKLGDHDHRYALGFDIPFERSLKGFSVTNPVIFGGWTGCRIFFAENPRVTVCFLTNRVLSGDTAESRQRFSEFSWNTIREVLR